MPPFLASYSRSLREQGLADSAMDDLDFEQDFGKSKPKAKQAEAKRPKKKGFSIFSVHFYQHLSLGSLWIYFL